MPRRRCYPSDTWDDKWALIESLLPVPACDTPTGGRPEKHPRREIVFTDCQADRMGSDL
ncbi:hypothetical protein SMALB_8973 [Streptomyces malaysiensis]|uniref:Transposase n=1 Tax=Streptomyces malaysiensis TaxID=92644 RepID=A0A7X6B2K6_STRMQ|nr:hypothetical protein [Streptomyces malaysiensis]